MKRREYQMLQLLPEWIRYTPHAQVLLVSGLISNVIAIANAIALARRDMRARAGLAAAFFMPGVAMFLLAIGLWSQFLMWDYAAGTVAEIPPASRAWCFSTAEEILGMARLALAGAIAPVLVWIAGIATTVRTRASMRGNGPNAS